MATDSCIKEGLLGVAKKGGRIESRYFLLYKDRLEYFKSQEDFASGSEPRGRVGLSSIQECDELDDSSGFKLILGEGKGLEVKVYKGQEELDAWLDALASVWADGEPADAQEASRVTEKKHALEIATQAPAAAKAPAKSDEKNRGNDDARLQVSPVETPAVSSTAPVVTPVSPTSPLHGGAAYSTGELTRAMLASPAVASADHHKGWLKMVRKGKADRRYFVLQEDRLTYFLDEGAMKLAMETNQQPRGMLMLSGISHIEENDAGFTIFMVEENRSVQLETEADEDTDRWLRALDIKLKVSGLKSAVTPRSRETLSFRFDKLDFKAIDQNAFKEELLNQFRGLGMAEGVISRMRIAFRPGSIIADVTGIASAVQELREKALNKTILVMGSSPIVMDVARSVEFPKLRSVSWKKTKDGEVGTVVDKGEVGVLKKGVPEPRYLVLFTDRFEFYENVNDFQEGADPRSRVTHQDVQNLEFLADGMNIHHPKRLFNLRTDSDPAVMQKWFNAWNKVFDFQIDGTELSKEMSAEKPAEPAKDVSTALKSSSNKVVQKASPDEVTKKKRKEKSDGASTDASTNSSPPTPAPISNTSVITELPSMTEESLQPREPILHQGILSMLKKGQPERRHMVLYYDRLEIYTNPTDMTNGVKPRGRIVISDIQEIDVLDMGFSFKLPDRNLNLHAIHKADFLKWQAAFDKACERRMEQEKAKDAELAKDTQNREGMDQTSASGMTSIHEGEVMLEYQGSKSSSSRYVVLVSEGIKIYADKKARLQNAEFQAFIAKTEVKSLDVLDTGFEVQAAEKSCIVRPPPPELDGWLQSLGCLFEDDQKEEPLQSRSQLQEVPSFGHSEHPRLVWHSMLEVQEGGHGVWKYFALHEDALVSYNSANEMASANAPEGRIPLNQVQDVKVGSMGFVLQFPMFNLAFRVSNEPGALDAWVSALHQVLVFSGPESKEAAHSEKLLHQGTLELVEELQAKLQHFCLYTDRLEHFGSTADALNGRRCQDKIVLADVLGFKVIDRGFVIRLAGKEVELRVVCHEDLEVWLAAFRGVFDDQSRRQALSSQEPPADALNTPGFPGTPGFGSASNSTWKEWSSSNTPRQGFKMVKVLKLLFPAVPWPAPDKFEAELRRILQTIGTPRVIPHNLGGVSFKDGCVTAEILGSDTSLEELRRAISLPNAQFSVCGYKVGDASIGTAKILADVNSGKGQKGQAAIYQGPLGIQHGGCLSQKYFMLFEDRLDYFDSRDDALAGVRPRGRIALCEVNSYEAYGSGFILKLLGRSVGLHVSADGKDQWSKCLLEILKSSTAAETSKPNKGAARQQGSWGAGRVNGAKSPKAKPRPRSTTPRRRPQPPFGTSGSANDDTAVNSSQSLNGSSGIMRLKNAGSPALSNASKAEGANGWVSTRGDEERDVRKGDGGLWLSRDVSGKVIERDTRVVWTRRTSDSMVTDKVTGDRCATGALATKLSTPRLADAAPKVNQSLTPRGSPTLGQSRSSPEITGKVNEAGRVAKSIENSLHHRHYGKITESGRDSGWLHRGREKVQNFDKAAGLHCAALGATAQRNFPFASA